MGHVGYRYAAAAASASFVSGKVSLLHCNLSLTNEFMHGVYALQHVISLVDWPKHVKFLFSLFFSLCVRCRTLRKTGLVASRLHSMASSGPRCGMSTDGNPSRGPPLELRCLRNSDSDLSSASDSSGSDSESKDSKTAHSSVQVAQEVREGPELCSCSVTYTCKQGICLLQDNSPRKVPLTNSKGRAAGGSYIGWCT